MRLHYLQNEFCGARNGIAIDREHDMHMNCIAGKVERQFIKETTFRQIKIPPIANFLLIAKY